MITSVKINVTHFSKLIYIHRRPTITILEPFRQEILTSDISISNGYASADIQYTGFKLIYLKLSTFW